MLKVQDDPNLIRDPNSKAVLQINKTALEEHRRKKTMLKNLLNDSSRITILEKEVADLKRQIAMLINKE